MAWTTTDWADADWSDIANINDFVDAIQERHKALNNGTPHPTITRRVTRTTGTCSVAGTALTATAAKFPEEDWGVASQFRTVRITLAEGTCTVVGTDLTATAPVFLASHEGHFLAIPGVGTFTITEYVSTTEVTLSAAADCEGMAFSVYDWFNIVAWVSNTQVTLDADATCTATAFSAEGDDVQAAAWWSAMQEWVEANYTSFVISADGGVSRGAGFYDGISSPPAMYATLAQVFASTDLENSTWRRYTTHPNEEGENLGGKLAAGSIIGPWFFADLQKVLNALVWTSPAQGWTSDSANNVGHGEGDDWPGREGWGFAKQEAIDDWAESENDGGDPQAYTAMRFYDETWFAAQLGRTIAKGKLTSLWSGVKRAVEWYIKTDKAALYQSTWHTQGDYGILQGLYSLWLTDDPALDAETVLSSVYMAPELAKPTYWKSAPLGPNWEIHGYETYAQAVVVRWDIDDGFAYTA